MSEAHALEDRIKALPGYPEVQFDNGHYEMDAEELRDLVAYYRERLRLTVGWIEEARDAFVEAEVIEESELKHIETLLAACKEAL